MTKIYAIYDYAIYSHRGFFSSRKKAEEELKKLQEACRTINDIRNNLLYSNPRFLIKSYELNKID